MDSYQIEPELLRPAPRPIRRRAGRPAFVGCFVLLIMPHTIVGLFMLMGLIQSLIGLFLGPVVPATVVAHNTTHSSKGGTSYHLRLSYDVYGDHEERDCTVGSDAYNRIEDGAAIEVKLMNRPRLLPGIQMAGAVPLFSPTAPLGAVAAQAGFTLFWDGIVGVFLYILLVLPWLYRSLVINGVPVEGRITGKKVQSGKSTTYYLLYEFTPLPSGLPTMDSLQPLRSKMTVRSQEYHRAQEGERVTVLYREGRPKLSVLYEYGDYEVVGP